MKCSSCSDKVRPVVAVDIDGTLGDHHGHFADFAEDYTGSSVGEWRDYRDGFHDIIVRQREPYPYDIEFSDWLGLPKPLYREVKLAYRQGGMKRLMPVFDGAMEFIDNVRSLGAEVWLCTTRPYMRLDNIDPDTREWARRNRIAFDGLIYGEDKYERLAHIVDHERIVAVLDDLPEMVDAAVALGLPGMQKRNGHRGASVREPFATTLDGASRLIGDRIRAWNRAHR